ncbi:hypothetical protein D3C79_1056590 [compost metagenome]
MESAPLLTIDKPTRDEWLNAKYVDREETQDGLENQEMPYELDGKGPRKRDD